MSDDKFMVGKVIRDAEDTIWSVVDITKEPESDDTIYMVFDPRTGQHNQVYGVSAAINEIENVQQPLQKVAQDSPVQILPTGTIAMSEVNSELGRPSTQGIDLNDADVRLLAEVGGGQISMSDLKGKSNAWSETLYVNSTCLNLFEWAKAQGWNETSRAIITIAPGVYVNGLRYPSQVPAIKTGGPWPGGLYLINNGYIIGSNTTAAATPGIFLDGPIEITNNGYICGSGGYGRAGSYQGGLDAGFAGGGSGAGSISDGENTRDQFEEDEKVTYGGQATTIGGANGGNGAVNAGSSTVAAKGGGAGGGGGFSSGTAADLIDKSGGAGAGGLNLENPFGGTGSYDPADPSVVGGVGGSANNTGGDAGKDALSGGGGGGFGAKGGDAYDYSGAGLYLRAGFPGKNAIVLNGYEITWKAYGTIWGAIT